MANLSVEFADIRSSNPFWLTFVPPTDKAYNAIHAYQTGWGRMVWRIFGENPAAVGVSSRYSTHFRPNRQVQGINNVELITDRSLEINLREIAQVKEDQPDRTLIVLLMVPYVEESWKYILPLVETTGADGIELNFGCPHGIPECGMGTAVGQVPEYVEIVTRWCETHCSLLMIVKLTPNITDVRQSTRVAHRGGADVVSLINAVNSITSVGLERMIAPPVVGTQSTRGGYYDSAMRPIAPNMVAEVARDPQTRGLPICGIGGIGSWRDAAGFVALGYGAVQIYTVAMLHGLRIVEDMRDGPARWMDSRGYQRPSDLSGGTVGNITGWKYLDVSYRVTTHIDQDICIGCGRYHIAYEDTSYQAIISLPRVDDTHRYEAIDTEYMGCNLCQTTCPVENCIEMMPRDTGKPYPSQTRDPRDPYREVS